MDHCIYDPYIFPNSPYSLGDLPFPATNITVNVSGCNSFKALRSLLERLSVGGLDFEVQGLFFSRSFTAFSVVISLFGFVLKLTALKVKVKAKVFHEKIGFSFGQIS